MLLCAAPVLVAPHPKQAFQLHVDASHVGSEAVLTYMDDLGIGRPVSYFSKKSSKHHLNYFVML